MKKRSLRILSIVMVLVMLFSVTATSALAAETNIGKGEQQLIMEQMGYETKTLEFATATTEKFSFTTASGIDSTVEKMVLSNGDEVYNVVEGELENTLVVKPNGDIYLDGNLVKITENAVETGLMAAGDNDLVVPRAQRHEFTDICPYGQPADYSNGSYTQRTLEFERILIEITEWAFIKVVCAAMSMVGIPDFFGAIETIMGNVLDAAQSLHPLDDALSMRDYRYVHGTLGFNVTSSMSVAKHITSFYAEWDYTDPIYFNGTTVMVGYEVFTY